ncbi:hypothetical protein SISSUDRAFT_702613 [Sistotremastrum suecicum HHB10207 ss-3]|uniref:NOT2/NOT3/NOT5 C-terminal domain-containing protein n=1 Tax=Sistotremastrum suecicum HHB10207 ss-3 TaxID=1314776 RepID=A0A166DWA8_9AGAM|nr:hypothetical protein SISSUDRAFT_702613 [Sistotremastrum suecicum HHB10207 ss-3]
MSSLPAAPTAVPQYPPGVNVPGLQKPSGSTEPIAPLAQDREAVGRPGSTNVFTGQENLLVSFDGAKQKATNRMTDLNHVHKLLEAGYPNMPQPQDTAKPKYYVPKNPHQTPSYYPQMPNPVLSTSRVFAQLDVETLFYVFYYLPGTYQQYLAAKELKKQSWRFHVKYLTWFQRHSEPQAITEEYEQGVYVYFDWEGSWCQRKKSDFRFEYRYLSED